MTDVDSMADRLNSQIQGVRVLKVEAPTANKSLDRSRVLIWLKEFLEN